jgi:hypothetical protein
MTRSELIAALETATGPSRDLDAEIAAVAGVQCRSRRTAGGKNKGREWLVDTDAGGIEMWSHHPPAYTGSMDAILVLVPSTWQWHCGTCNEDDMPWATLTDTDTWADYGAEAATPTLALCSACIKARESGG